MPFVYPTAVAYQQIQPELVRRASENRLGMSIFPSVPRNAGVIRWTQRDHFGGLQQLRGLDGKPGRIRLVGERTFEYEPGVYGEYYDITETELLRRAGNVDINTTNVNVGDLVAEADDVLINREQDRIESSIWAVLTTGIIEVYMVGASGERQVGFRDEFDIQTFTATVSWATYATATPFLDLQAVGALGLPSGNSNNLGAGARAIMNSVTANHILNNRNENDIAGKRLNIGQTYNTLTQINQLFISNNLPSVEIYDGGYFANDDGTGYTKFIPDNKVVVLGSRPGGATIGEYLLTRNAMNAGYAPGSYRFVVDRTQGTNGEKRVPPNIEVHRGHNGGPVIYYPGSICVMNV